MFVLYLSPQLESLRGEFEQVSDQLDRTQLALKEASEELREMQMTTDENGTLRNQLHEEEVNKWEDSDL